MYVHNVSRCDFVVWTPKTLILCIVTRDDGFKDSLLVLDEFFMRNILPELLTRKLENEKVGRIARKRKRKVNETVYCLCRQPFNGDMIGCDDPTCKYEWFHLKCVKLVRPPKGHWFCKECKKKQK